MTHTELLRLAFLKSAGIGELISAPFFARPGFKALRDARREIGSEFVNPTAQQLIAGHQGGYDSTNRIVKVLTTADDPIGTGRHELMHGYQDVLLRKDKSPLSIFGAKVFNPSWSPATLRGGLQHAAMELDARIGAMRNIPGAVADLARNSSGYVNHFQGLGKLPYSILGLLGKVL